MKSFKLLAGLVLLILALSAAGTAAYTPQGEGFVQVLVFATSEDKNDVVLGNSVDFSIVIENLWNDTMSNLTIVQSLQPNTELLSLGGLDITETETSLTDVTLEDGRTGEALSFTYLNTTESNFTGNIDITLQPGNDLVLDFSLNFTTLGDFSIAFPELTYYDHWGDKQDEIRGQGTVVTIVEDDVDTRTRYIPSFSTIEPDYTLILGGLGLLFVVAVMGRVTHGNKPVEV